MFSAVRLVVSARSSGAGAVRSLARRRAASGGPSEFEFEMNSPFKLWGSAWLCRGGAAVPELRSRCRGRAGVEASGPKHTRMTVGKEELLAMFKSMLLIRRMEIACDTEYKVRARGLPTVALARVTRARSRASSAASATCTTGRRRWRWASRAASRRTTT